MSHLCACVGPQNGQPLCPCRMKNLTIEDGRYVEKKDFGPVWGREVPVIPPLPDSPFDSPLDPNPVVAICGKCGLHLRKVMHYYCGQSRCPTGLGSPWG